MLTPRLLKKFVFFNSSLPIITVDILSFQESSTITQDFAFTEDDISFSFKQKLTDNEFIKNQNIIDMKELSLLKNLNSDSENKFSETSDPFYDLDESREQLLKKEDIKVKQQELTKNNINKKLRNTKIVKSTNLKRRYN